jgi:hypothetical protein
LTTGAQFLEKFIIYFITFKTQKPLKPSTTPCSYACALQQEMLCGRMGKGDVHTRKKNVSNNLNIKSSTEWFIQ